MKKAIVCVFLSLIMAVHACTVWVLAPDITTSGKFIIHKTRDRGIWRKLETKLRWYPGETAGKLRLLEFGDWMYMNEKGMFIFNTNIPKCKDAVKDMEGIATTMRYVASQCPDIESALKMLKDLVESKEHNIKHTFYIISDHTGAYMVEISTTKISYRKVENGFAVHTNHFFFYDMAHLFIPEDGGIKSAIRLQITNSNLAKKLAKQGKLSEMDSLETSRFVMPDKQYPEMSPFRTSTVCCADYLPDTEYPGILGTLFLTPGPSRYTAAMSVPISIGKIPAPLEDGTLGKLSYQVKDKLPMNEATLDKFRALETRLRQEYVACQENARKLLKENKTDEAKKMLDENVAKQSDALMQLFKEILAPFEVKDAAE